MMTEIHAQVNINCFLTFIYRIVTLFWYFQSHKTSKDYNIDGPLAKKHAGDKNKLTAEKKKILKDKKRTLKRL